MRAGGGPWRRAAVAVSCVTDAYRLPLWAGRTCAADVTVRYRAVSVWLQARSPRPGQRLLLLIRASLLPSSLCNLGRLLSPVPAQPLLSSALVLPCRPLHSLLCLSGLRVNGLFTPVPVRRSAGCG